MLSGYVSLRHFPLQSVSGVKVAHLAPPPPVTLDSPAPLVMTDFLQIPAATIEPEASADYSTDYMRRRNVRALLVLDGGEVVGILTATDVLGEKPIKLALSSGMKRAEIRVVDLMTPRASLELLAYEEVRQARVGHVVETLRQAGRQHFLVGEHAPDGERVRGIFSISQIARQLGIAIETVSFAQTFAEIEAALRD